MRTVKAATAYFAIVFALGFVLGTLRVVWIAPAVGEAAAVLAEVPAMLAASFLAARWLVRRFAVESDGTALGMGALAFALLMAAEMLLGLLLFGETPGGWLASLFAIPGALGLAGQIGFAAMPWAVVRLEKRR